MTTLTPIQFHPVIRRYLWGGRRLGDVLQKPIGDGDDYAESWEVVDHGNDQTTVRDGPFEGKSLRQIVQDFGPELFGRHAPQPQFPLLFKFLDANQNLSVQVHPNDQQAARLDPPDLGKTEAWLILASEPGSRVYAGLKRGFDRAAFEREISRGTTELCLHSFEPQVGDCVFIPAGTVHALGKGLLVAEIQQASDTTFRLFDWNRVDKDGRPRDLHTEQALDVIDFDRGPVKPLQPQQTDRPEVECLVANAKFVMDRWTVEVPMELETDQRFHILTVLGGQLSCSSPDWEGTLNFGETLLIPACTQLLRLEPIEKTVLLDMYLPG